MEKINFLSEIIVNSAEGCARNIWIGVEPPVSIIEANLYTPTTTTKNLCIIDDLGKYYIDNGWYGNSSDEYCTSYIIDGDNGISIQAGQQYKIICNPYISQHPWFKDYLGYSFLFGVGLDDNDLVCSIGDGSDYVQKIDDTTYIITIPEGCKVPLISHTIDGGCTAYLLDNSIGNDGDIYFQYETEEE